MQRDCKSRYLGSIPGRASKIKMAGGVVYLRHPAPLLAIKRPANRLLRLNFPLKATFLNPAVLFLTRPALRFYPQQR